MKHILAVLCALLCFSGSAEAQKKPAPKAKTATAAIPAAALQAGKTVYAQNCLTCHQADGLGVDGMNPPLSKTTFVLGDKARLVNILLKGMQGVDIDGEEYNNVMPAFNNLTDQQIADVLTYVRNSFGNKATAVKAPEVKAVRATK